MMEVGTQNGDRAKAIDTIQTAFPVLTDSQLGDVAGYVKLHLAVSKYLEAAKAFSEVRV